MLLSVSMLCFYDPWSPLHLSVIGWDRQSVIRQRGGEAGRNRRAGDPVGMDVLAVATKGALVIQGDLGAFCHRFARLWLRLGGLTLADRLLGVRAEVRRVQTVPCGDEGSGRFDHNDLKSQYMDTFTPWSILHQELLVLCLALTVTDLTVEFDIMFWSLTLSTKRENDKMANSMFHSILGNL